MIPDNVHLERLYPIGTIVEGLNYTLIVTGYHVVNEFPERLFHSVRKVRWYDHLKWWLQR